MVTNVPAAATATRPPTVINSNTVGGGATISLTADATGVTPLWRVYALVATMGVLLAR